METLKFNEYNALREQLIKEGSSINELVKEVTGEFLNEAGEELDVEKPKLMWIKSPKAAWAMRGLTKQAKQAKKIIDDNIIQKLYPKILENQKKILQQALGLLKKGSSKEQVKQSLQKNLTVAENLQVKQLKNINEAIDKILENFDKKIVSYISKKDLSDRRKLTVENYWVLLTTQIRQIAYNSMIEKEEEFLKEIIRENENLVTFADELSVKGDLTSVINNEKKKGEEAKVKVKEDKDGEEEKTTEAPEEKTDEKPEEKTDEKTDEKPEEKTTEAPEEKTDEKPEEKTDEKPEEKTDEKTDEKPEENLPKRGEIWQYKTKKDGNTEWRYARILKVGDGNEIEKGVVKVEYVKREGKFWKKAEYKGTNSTSTVSLKAFTRKFNGKKLKDATPEGSFDPSMYKKGEKYNYKNSKGKESIIEIVGEEDGGVRVKHEGSNKEGWIVRKDGLIGDKIEKKSPETTDAEETPVE